MGSLRPDPTSRIHPEPEPEPEPSATTSLSIDHFDRLPDSLLLLVFNKIGDVKALGRCCVVCLRFHSLVPQVDNVVVRVDCVISDDDTSSSSSSTKSHSPSSSSSGFSSIFRLVLGGIVKPFQALGQLIGPKVNSRNGFFNSSLPVGTTITTDDDTEPDQAGVTHHSPTQVLKNFNEIRFLRIELPSGELGIDDGKPMLYCNTTTTTTTTTNNIGVDDNGSIPESFYTNGGLKLRVVWTISSLIAASARHYLLQPIIAEHKTLDSLVLTDADGQGVLCMNREQLEELRVKPLSASSASKRTLVPALNMRLWYAPQLELPDGVVLKGATLVAIRPSDHAATKKDVTDVSWLSTAFEEPYGTAAKMLVKRRTYCLEMNSF
ncbi:hypothetical protein OIU85_022680 [Salix viminalis]|uniref:F-box domain-containing protein n=1 Tax=Salix viminalis TaxID=40686 RepID=A0A9Q0Z878_SALVM|nr:hypothetical protein OIU85_022680 [Salix viminalis]